MDEEEVKSSESNHVVFEEVPKVAEDKSSGAEIAKGAETVKPTGSETEDEEEETKENAPAAGVEKSEQKPSMPPKPTVNITPIVAEPMVEDSKSAEPETLSNESSNQTDTMTAKDSQTLDVNEPVKAMEANISEEIDEITESTETSSQLDVVNPNDSKISEEVEEMMQSPSTPDAAKTMDSMAVEEVEEIIKYCESPVEKKASEETMESKDDVAAKPMEVESEKESKEEVKIIEIEDKEEAEKSPPPSIVKPTMKMSGSFSSFVDLSAGMGSEAETSSEEEGEFGFRKLPYPKFDRSYTITASFNSGVFGSFLRPKLPELVQQTKRKRKGGLSGRVDPIMTRSRKRNRHEMEGSGGGSDADPSIARILKKQKRNGKLCYLVVWPHESTPRWETAENMQLGHERSIDQFERRSNNGPRRRRTPRNRPKPVPKPNNKRKRNAKDQQGVKRKKIARKRTGRTPRSEPIVIRDSDDEMPIVNVPSLPILGKGELPPDHPQLLQLKREIQIKSRRRAGGASKLLTACQELLAIIRPEEETIQMEPHSSCKDYLDRVRTLFITTVEPEFATLFMTNARMKREISKFDAENRKLNASIQSRSNGKTLPPPKPMISTMPAEISPANITRVVEEIPPKPLPQALPAGIAPASITPTEV